MSRILRPDIGRAQRRWRGFGLAGLILGAGCLASSAGDTRKATPSGATGSLEIQVAPPPLTEGIFPCTQCHDGKTVKLNTKPRKLVDMHDDIVLKHGPESRWCLDCHDPTNRDMLHLASGERIDFGHSYLLCAQCHGDKFRDWKVGVHGKRIGEWNGRKQYFLCVSCHVPHSPRFQPLKPLPPPEKPEARRASGAPDRKEGVAP